MFTFTSFTSCSSAIRSSTGDTMWHGPHHSAQKSTITLPSVCRTSCSNVSLVATVAIDFLSWFTSSNVVAGWILPARYDRKHVHPVAGQARPSGAGAGDSRALVAGGDVRAAAG